MSRYDSLCKAISVMTSIKATMESNGLISTGMQSVIEDLRAIARDVRYGGVWDGEFERVASALNICKDMNCTICPYQDKRSTGCKSILKEDAAAVIRQLAKTKKELLDMIAGMDSTIAEYRVKLEKAEMFMSKEQKEDARQAAQWQLDDMKTGNTPPESFPWEGKEDL